MRKPRLPRGLNSEDVEVTTVFEVIVHPHRLGFLVLELLRRAVGSSITGFLGVRIELVRRNPKRSHKSVTRNFHNTAFLSL